MTLPIRRHFDRLKEMFSFSDICEEKAKMAILNTYTYAVIELDDEMQTVA